MSFDPKGYALSAEDGTAVWFLDTRMTVKAGGDETNGAFTFLEWAAPMGFGPPPHRHDREDEAFYLIEGAIEVSCGDRQWEVGPGGFVFLPRGIPHSFKVVGETVARCLVLGTPAGVDQYFVDAGTPALEEGLRPQPIDFQKLAAISAQYGMEILGPSPF